MTDIKEPINTTSDGAFLSVVCENPKKVLLAKSWGGGAVPPPPRNYPPEIAAVLVSPALFFTVVNSVGVIVIITAFIVNCNCN